jgi:hypothetical protein
MDLPSCEQIALWLLFISWAVEITVLGVPRLQSLLIITVATERPSP